MTRDEMNASNGEALLSQYHRLVDDALAAAGAPKGTPRTELVNAVRALRARADGAIAPKIAEGGRVRTATTARGMAMFPGSAFRRDAALGVVKERVRDTWPESWRVTHDDDGTEASYERGELTPLLDEQALREASPEVARGEEES